MSFRNCADVLFEACLGTYGEMASYQAKSGEAFTLMGIFIKDYELIQTNSFDSVVSTSAPAVEVSSKDIRCQPKAGDRVSVRGESYRVVEVQPNGEGQVRLILKR